MKKNKILFAALASTMFVGCADQDFLVVENGGVQDLNGKLVEAGLLTGSRGEESATRALTAKGKFVWMPTELAKDGSLTEARKNQRVGFCWTGNNHENPAYSVVGNPSYVYTNYEYEHVGWLDVKATAPDDQECYDGVLRNGAYIKGEGTPEAHFAGTSSSEFFNKYYYQGWADDAKAPYGKYDGTDHPESSSVLNLGSGIFRTNNASVFEGEYLIYYPYTDAFTKGEIVAHMPTVYNVTVKNDAEDVDGKYIQNKYAASSDAAFAIGYLNHYEGGSAATSFTSKTLNAYVGVKLSNWKDGANNVPADVNIKTVMLYSETQGIMYSQKLDASKAIAGLKAGQLGTDIFCGTPEKKNVVYATLTDGENEYTTVEGTENAPAEYVEVVLPVFPQTISDLQIVLVNEKDQTYTVPASATTFACNGAYIQEINLANVKFVNEYMVVDEASLWSAWEKIDKTGAAIPETNNIKMLNDIRLEGEISGKDIYNSFFFTKNINIYSKCNAELSFASENETSINGYAAGTGVNEAVLTIDVPVTIEGAGCCDNTPAVLVVGNAADKTGKVVFKQDVTNYGTLALNNNGTTTQTVEIKGTLTNAYDEWAVKKNKTTGAAEVYMLGTNATKLNINKFINKNGKAVVAATSIDIDKIFVESVLPAVLNGETATSRQVAVTINELTNDVLFDIHKMAIVTVNNSFNNTTDAVIMTQGEAQSATDGRLDVLATTSNNNGVIDNQGVINLMQTLTNTGLFVDRQSGQVGGKMINNGTATGATKKYGTMTYTTDLPNAGIYVAQVETSDRMKKILSDVVIEPSVNIVEVLGIDLDLYNMFDYEDNMGDKDLVINSAEPIYVSSFDDNAKAQLRDLAHCVTVLGGSSLLALDGRLVVKKDVLVEKDAVATINVKYNADKSNLVVVGNVTNKGTFNNSASYFEVDGNLANEQQFNSTTAFKVLGNVTNTGNFISKGNNNIVGGNFTQTAGYSEFASKTTTTIENTFSCTGGQFERLTVGGEEHRATVNVNVLGSVVGGTTSTAWPTEY